MILRPQYTQRPIEVLLVGPANSGKRTLADQLISCRDTFISISTNEELPKNAFEILGHVDFIFFVLDMTNRESLVVFEKALEHIAPEYLVNRCAVLITKIDRLHKSLIDENRVQFIIDRYTPDMQLFRCNLTDNQERRKLCDQMTRLIRINQLQQKDITMSLIKSAVYYNHFPYSFRQPDDSELTPTYQTDNSEMLSPTLGQDNDNNSDNDDFNEGGHVNEDDLKEVEQVSENKMGGDEHVTEDDNKQEDHANNNKDVDMDENDTNENQADN